MSILKIKALEIEKELALLNFLNQFGHAEIVGSVASDLIINKDLDIHLLTIYDLTHIKSYVLDYLNSKDIDTYVEDLRKEKSSIYVQIKNYKDWNIDIWLTNNINYTGFELSHSLKLKLNIYTRKCIMDIKYHYYNLGLLYGEMSTRIYEAVLWNNVHTIEEFEHYYK